MSAANAPPGRIVMLVDNSVLGDSRVQKVARSAAEAGWDVILLGRAPGRAPQQWRLGPAEVRLLHVPFLLRKRPHEFRRRLLTAPFGYPPTGIANYRAQRIRAWKAEVMFRRARHVAGSARAHPAQTGLAQTGLAQTGLAQTGPARVGLARVGLAAQWFAARAAGRWVASRKRQKERADRARRGLDGWWDRLYTRFWLALRGDRAWGRLEPELWDYELAYGPAVDELRPDLIHAHDFRMVGVGARAVIRARAAGRTVKLVWDAHEFLPGAKPWRDNARWLVGNMAHEREYAPYADAVVTVSDELADLLRRQHALAEPPAVVLNAPAADHAPGDDPAPDLRGLCGVRADTPLLVYSGAAAPQRGLDIMVEALPQLPDAHVALVVNQPTGPYLTQLLARAAELGVARRVHPLPYVPHWHVVPMLAGADAGVIPLHHWPNHEISLITKFFEYAHARLPLVVSDVRTMAATVRATGQGEVFRAEDVADYVRAVRAVLATPETYRAAYDKPGVLDGWTWRAQAAVLDGLYRRLLATPSVAAAPASPGPLTGSTVRSLA